ncbi:MAG TPA: hypothetical protein VHQ47_17510 [Phycisphaerae bacterium]|nr:hypothetical protein [Phycisphaerae bacterium]
MRAAPLILPLACILLARSAAAATPDPQSVVRQKVQDLFTASDQKIQWQFSRYANKTFTADNIRITPDSGQDRLDARDGHPPGPILTIRQLSFTLAADPTPNDDLRPTSITLDHPTVPAEKRPAADTQPSGRDTALLFMFVDIMKDAFNTNWTKIFTLDGDASPGQPPAWTQQFAALQTITVHDFRYETSSPVQHMPAAFILTVDAARQPTGIWNVTLLVTTDPPAAAPEKPDLPAHLQLKIDGHDLLARSPLPSTSVPP